MCTNTPGSYACSCWTGYTLNADGKGCTGNALNIIFVKEPGNNVCKHATLVSIEYGNMNDLWHGSGLSLGMCYFASTHYAII